MIAVTTRIMGPVALELGDMLESIEHSGMEYAKAYLQHVVERTPMPFRPRDLHPHVARAIRDIVLDRAVFEQVCPPHKVNR